MTLSPRIPEQTRRIIDANIDRIGEGLRLLEDIARFLLNDAPLTQQLKNMRHELLTVDLSLSQQLLQARRAEADIGTNIKAPQQAKERELPQVIVANARRVQESLRVVEELSKTPGIKLDPEKYKKARFNLYTIERDLMSRLLRKDQVERITGFYAIVDTQALSGRSHIRVAEELIRGGSRVVQLRDKTLSSRKLLPIARELRELCVEHDVLFIVNDYLDIAMAANADGLHLGQDDLPVTVARDLLPMDKLLGCSVTTAAQAMDAETGGADYIAAGAIFATGSKKDITVIGLEGLKQIKKTVKLPVVAIGGINLNNVDEVLAAGADSAALISAILKTESPGEAARQIVARIIQQQS